MTPAEKAKATRRKHAEFRKAKDQAQKEMIETMKRCCLEVMNDLKSTSAEKIKATEILFDLTKGR